MTDKEKTDLAKTFEKAWFQSKKFLAFLSLMGAYMAFVICTIYFKFDFGLPVAIVFSFIVVTIDFVVLVLIGKQAMIDKYTRIIALTGRIGSTPSEDDEE